MCEAQGSVEVYPHPKLGLATIWDWDVMIVAASTPDGITHITPRDPSGDPDTARPERRSGPGAAMVN